VLYVEAVGTRTRETVVAMAKEILAASQKHATPKVLVNVQKLAGRLDTLDAYEIPATQFAGLGQVGIVTQAAIVDLKEYEKSFKFFETVAINRGFNIRIFGDVDEARAWLA
jgi:hypothetical protein